MSATEPTHTEDEIVRQSMLDEPDARRAIARIKAEAWDEGRRAGVDDMIAAEVGSFRRRKPNPYRTTKEN